MRLSRLFAFSSLYRPALGLLGGSVFSLLALSGCARGQTGGDINIGDEASGSSCEDVSSESVTADDSLQGVGFTAQDLADAIAGDHEVSMLWGSQQWADSVTVTPAAGETTLHVSIEAQLETARWVTRAASSSSGTEGGGLTVDIAESNCRSELRMDARVHVKSDNGAFDDIFTATFSMKDGVVAEARIELSPGELNGSFAVDTSALENGAAEQTWLQLSFAFGALSGAVSGLITTSNGQVASAGSANYGRFPVSNPCSYGYAMPDDVAIVQQIRNAIEEHRAFEFTWQGESAIDLDVAPSVGSFCFEANDYSSDSYLTADVSVVVTTSDDSIDGTWPLSLRAELQEGQLAHIAVFRDAYMANTFSAGEFESKTGISGVNSSAEQLSYTFGWDIDFAADFPATGELTLLEMVVPPCAQPGYVPPVEESPDGGMSSPGCEGISVVEFKNGTMIER